MRNPSEFFPRMYIADMDLDDRRFNGSNRIPDGNRRMRIPARVQDDTVR